MVYLMKKIYYLLIGIMMAAAGMAANAQDSTKIKAFDFSKIRPIVHFFANAEYNPSEGVSKDYSFWIGRMMFGFSYQFDKHWSGKILIDRTRLTGSMNTMYVKVANLRWTPDDRLAIEAGAINQNEYIPFETYWGYRFVAETFPDRYYSIPSTDLGIAAYYKIGKYLSADASISNGEGPRIDQDSYGRLKLAGGLNFFPENKLHARVFYHYKSSGDPSLTASEHLFNASLGYQPGKKIRLGADFTYISGFLNIPSFKTYGGTIFGCFTLYKTLQFIARYDRLIVKNHSESPLLYSNTSTNALITGFSISPAKGIILCLNYQGSWRIDQSLPPQHRLLFTFEFKI